MSTYEERIAALEQTSVSRLDFLNAVNRVMLQQAQCTSETYHEITILLGVVGSQGQDIKTIKEDVSTLKGDVGILKGDVSTLKGNVSILKGDVSLIKERLNEHTARFDHLETLLAQVDLAPNLWRSKTLGYTFSEGEQGHAKSAKDLHI